jgi:hypothetical protein
MKFAVLLIGVVFIAIGAIYFGMPANKLPSFFPGFDPANDQIHLKHGLVAAAIGLVALFASMRMKRPAR